MRGFVYLLCLAGLCLVAPAAGQQMIRLTPRKPVICYQHFENRPGHVAPPRRLHDGSARTKTATFQVEYVDFPDDGHAKAAFEYALSIWEAELVSPVPIRVRAEWRSLRPGVLGEAIWGSAYANFGGEPHMNTFYPVALAEKLAGRALNEASEPDVIATFNGNASWYFGLDGDTPLGHMDFVTIALHEVAHGLGFTHSYNVHGATGDVGLFAGADQAPIVFDLFVEDKQQKNLFREFQAPSPALAVALQSGNLFFRIEGGDDARLYAPSTFNGGSSVSHLDESTYSGSEDANRLMTPHIAYAESIHHPGDVLRAMFTAMGWRTTTIAHTTLRDTERDDGAPYPVEAAVISDVPYDASTVKLHYTLNGQTFTTLPMNVAALPDHFEASLPGTSQPRSYGYYLSVEDAEGRRFTSPGQLQTQGEEPRQGLHYFTVGPDDKPPEIAHDPVPFIVDVAPELTVTAEVTDNLEVAGAALFYALNDAPWQEVSMNRTTGDAFQKVLVFPDARIGDEVRYRIEARDASQQQNVARLPLEGAYAVQVVGIMPARDSYVNNFDAPTSDFFGDFRIDTPPGFQNGAIHTDHPYQNGTGPDDESHYTYQLQVPIRLQEEGTVMRFDEIVLVEPGENGSVFGSDGFYDYVAVEGSVDGGLTWKPLQPGYDARADNAWLSRYNSHILSHVSQATGDPLLFREREIDLLASGDFVPGDELLIRFRLFADQLANGWGWSIDNLVIQTPAAVTGVDADPVFAFDVFPVPAHTTLILRISGAPPLPLHLRITDTRGLTVHATEMATTDGQLTVDITHLADGVYFMKALAGSRLCIRKFLKVSR